MKGKFERGLESVELGLTRSGEEHWWDAELYRLRGELKLRQPQQDPMGAKECFEQALLTAETQKAKSLKLRAAASLATIDKRQDGNEDAPR
jgi:predicted ATPase